MELDFDKEINGLLRQAARSGEFVSVNTENHLDADEISAFAENALPEKTRNVYIRHFADCDRCRTILSNTILLNSEAETLTASNFIETGTPEIVPTRIPWYRKIFLMPNLAYTMGGLVLIFGGMFGFLILQNAKQNTASEVSQVRESETKSNGPNASDEGISYNSNSMANAANTSANISSANTSTAVSNTAVSATPAGNAEGIINPAKVPANQPSAPVSTDSKLADEDQMSGNQINNKDVSNLPLNGRSVTELKVKPEDDKKAKEETVSKSAPAEPSKPPPPAMASTQAESEKSDNVARARKSRRDAGLSETSRQISGKIFNRVNGVWIDSAYNNNGSQLGNLALPRTRTIRRGSNEYRKLDKQVRIIAESLGGAVIILWKDGAYRIQ